MLNSDQWAVYGQLWREQATDKENCCTNHIPHLMRNHHPNICPKSALSLLEHCRECFNVDENLATASHTELKACGAIVDPDFPIVNIIYQNCTLEGSGTYEQIVLELLESVLMKVCGESGHWLKVAARDRKVVQGTKFRPDYFAIIEPFSRDTDSEPLKIHMEVIDGDSGESNEEKDAIHNAHVVINIKSSNNRSKKGLNVCRRTQFGNSRNYYLKMNKSHAIRLQTIMEESLKLALQFLEKGALRVIIWISFPYNHPKHGPGGPKTRPGVDVHPLGEHRCFMEVFTSECLNPGISELSAAFLSSLQVT
jgi:hypothetical protein